MYYFQNMGSVSDLQGFIRIVIPDELYDSISVKTLPVRPAMSAQQVCKYNSYKTIYHDKK